MATKIDPSKLTAEDLAAIDAFRASKPKYFDENGNIILTAEVKDDPQKLTEYMMEAAAERAKQNTQRSADRRAEVATIGDETRKTIRASRNRGYNTPADSDTMPREPRPTADWFSQRHGNAYPAPGVLSAAPGQAPDMAPRASFYRDLADHRLGRSRVADTETASGLSAAAARNPSGGTYSAKVPFGTVGVSAGKPQPAALPPAVPIIAQAAPPAPTLIADTAGAVPPGSSLPSASVAPMPRVSINPPVASGPVGLTDRLSYSSPLSAFQEQLRIASDAQDALRKARTSGLFKPSGVRTY